MQDIAEKTTKVRTVEAFLEGLTRNDIDMMPFASDVVLASPLDPEHPARGKANVVAFLKTRVFPKVPVHSAKVERHIVEGDNVATLWEATFKLSGRDVVVPIFDFFRVSDGLIHEVRPYFDPKPLKDAAG
jgi:limonene-1,2-epoxide hydrolase